jgi:hypothetical protein
MLFNMNNQIEVASNHPNNCLPHNICSNPHSYHSNTLSLSDHSEIRLFKSQIELENFSLIHSFSPKLISLAIQQESTLLFNEEVHNPIDLTRYENGSLSYLGLARGTSENYEYFGEE